MSLGGDLGLGWGMRIGLGSSGFVRSGVDMSGVLIAKVAHAGALALASREQTSVLSMKARRFLI
jgi:hypothetical protein